jgi:hypothetical protein
MPLKTSYKKNKRNDSTMIKTFTRTTLVILFICSVNFVAKAQLGFNYSRYDIGTAVGFNTVFGDAQTQKTTESVNFNISYNQTPYTNFVFEAQLGKLTGGDSLHTTTGRYFNNDFYAFVFRGQLQFGEFIDYSRSPFLNGIKNFYISAGLGYIYNRITQINRYSYLKPGLYTPGLNSSKTPIIPIRIGYELKLFNKYDQPSVRIDLGYEFNYGLNDNIDGFVAGTRNDAYGQFALGVKFAIGGGVTSYRKQITY